VGAALVMAMTRTLFHAVVPGHPSLPSVAGRMNQELARDNERAMFVTAFLACLDVATGVLEYVNAGHNPPYRVTRGGSLEPVVGARGLPLGVFEDQSYATDRVLLATGDWLVAFTDGIVEATNPKEEAFGEPRFERALLDLGSETNAQRLVEGALEILAAFVAGAPPADDVTLLALKWRK
jgi:sigma-B regulation protein RsbU (phosphoserine phosphatase)